MTDRGAVSRIERRWALGLGVFAVLLTLVPYALAFARQGQDWVFTGFLLGVDDGNSYIAKMLTGSAGAWLFRSPYSTFPQSGLLFVFLPYLLLGKLAAGAELHLQLVVLFQVFRAAAGIVLALATYDFIAFFESRIAYRRFGTVLALFGGGLGWLLLAGGQAGWLGSLPLDFYSPETFGYLALFGLPHLALGRALMLWGLLALLKGPAGSGGVRAGLLWLGAGLFNPLSPAIGWLVMGALIGFSLLRKTGRQEIKVRGLLRAGIVAVLITAPIVVYSALASWLDPFFRLWTSQNTITSPHPLHYLVAYALFIPWAWRGWRRLAVSGEVVDRLPIVWVALLPVLAYAPVNLQRRLPEGLFLALVILVLRGIGQGTEVRLRPLALAGLAAAFPTTLILFAGSLQVAWQVHQPAFLPRGETAAYSVLADSAQAGAVVLAPMANANPIPAFAPLRVVIGLGPETIGIKEIEPRVDAFFAGALDPAARRALLEEFGVDYILAPPGVLSPSEGRLLFMDGGYRVYSVER